MLTLIAIANFLISTIITLLIVQFVLSLLLSFNVVNRSNDFVMALWKGLNALLEPLLAPLRRILPETGQIDFSPLALLVLLRILQFVLDGLVVSPALT